jgi:hypothetical protein
VVQVLIAVAIGLAVFGISMWAIRMLATPPPPEPDPDEVVSVSISYRCKVCGMQLTVTQAQGEETEAPRHHREEMERVEL